MRCAWFLSASTFKPGYIKQNKKNPCFHLSQISLNSAPLISEFNVNLQLFVKGMLNGQLIWEEKTTVIPEVTEIEETDILVYKDNCWKCNKEINQIYGWSVDVYGDTAKTVPNA